MPSSSAAGCSRRRCSSSPPAPGRRAWPLAKRRAGLFLVAVDAYAAHAVGFDADLEPAPEQAPVEQHVLAVVQFHVVVVPHRGAEGVAHGAGDAILGGAGGDSAVAQSWPVAAAASGAATGSATSTRGIGRLASSACHSP